MPKKTNTVNLSALKAATVELNKEFKKLKLDPTADEEALVEGFLKADDLIEDSDHDFSDETLDVVDVIIGDNAFEIVDDTKEKKAAAKKSTGKNAEKKEKKAKTPRYTRADGMGDALKKRPKTVTSLLTTASKNYVGKGGTENEKETQWYWNHSKSIMIRAELIEVNGDKITWLCE